MTADFNVYDGAPPPLATSPPPVALQEPTPVVAPDRPRPTTHDGLTIEGIIEGDNALAWTTPAFWHLLIRAGVHLSRPASKYAISGYEDKLRFSRSTVSLEMLADALDVPPTYARGYLRAINGRLEDLGVTVRERRLKADGVLGSNVAYTGIYVEPAEKRALYTRVATANRAVKKAEAAAKGSDAVDANRELAEAEVAAETAKSKLEAYKRESEYLPVERHAFAVFIDVKRAPACLIQPATTTVSEDN